MAKPSKEKVLEVMNQVEELALPDGAHWQLVHEKLNLPYGDVFEIISEDLGYFGARSC